MDTVFEAVIVPHRSLSRRGMRLLVAAIVTGSSVNAIRFWFWGAWPVVPFTLAGVVLALFLLQLNARRARSSETLRLSDHEFRVIRIEPNGRREERTLPAGWLRVDLQDSPGRVPRLWICDRNLCEEVGRALGEEEKRDLASALREAVHQLRNPRFDNVQLR
ncbi:MAG: DUF2244 domain-containing protein [Acetobacteraceae bacterium]|nr:DUF2244 domain-containing protein [Acetobacteraceae bacterium]